MQLTLDHVILRAADPAATLAELAEPARRAGARRRSTRRARSRRGIVRAGALDIEVLAIGAAPPLRPHGYGLGFTRRRAARRRRPRSCAQLGFPTSVATGATANGRSWAAVQVHGLLPGPVPAADLDEAARRHRTA